MKENLCKSYWLTLLLLTGCSCDAPNSGNNDLEPPAQQKKYYNLEAIDLGIEANGELSFVYNGQQLIKEGDIYLSEDLLVYRTHDGKWRATVIGKGGISSHLKISTDQTLLQEVAITTTNQVITYQDELGKEWPGMYNICNTCFANSVYKLIARCSGFDEALSKDIEGGIHTALRNIVNGIRLGYKSALKEEVVNRRVSKLFLDTITAKSRKDFNNGQQEDVIYFFQVIQNVIDTEGNYEPKDMQELKHIVHEFNKQTPSFKHIVYETETKDFYVQPRMLTFNAIPDANYWSLESVDKYLNLPQFILYTSSGIGGTQAEKIVEFLKIPLWNHTTNKPLEEKTYKLIGFAYHIGSDDAGHYKAYIHFNTYGWYEHNDASVRPANRPDSINTRKIMALYELQD